MRSRVVKWGHSLGVRIPKPFAEDVGLVENSPIEVRVKENEIVIMPLAKKEYSLESMVAKINKHNLHHEVDTDGPVGNESW